MVFLWGLIKGRYHTSPYMPKINTCTNSRTHSILFSFIRIGIFQLLFRREHLVQISSIRKSIGYIPFHISLFHISKRISFKRMFFMPKHTSFKICKFLKYFWVFGRQDSTILIKILRTSSSPCTFSYSQHIRIEVIFKYNITFVSYVAIIPDSKNRTRNILASLFNIINATIIQCNYITESIKMIKIVKLRINCRNAFLSFPTITPQMCHIYFTRFIMPSGIPGDHLFPFGTNMRNHFRNKFRIGKLNFIGTNMKIRYIKSLTNFIYQ